MSRSGRLGLVPRDFDLGWTPYVWLIYLPVFFVQPALRATPAVVWVAEVLGAAVFVVTYFRGHWVNGRALVTIVVAQVALGIGFAAVNTGSYVFFTYAGSFAARFERGKIAFAWIVAITAAGLAAAFLTHAPLYYWIGHGVFTPLVGAVNFHRAQVGRATEKLRAAHDQIEHLAAVAERERIARDLHDVLGHTLSLIVLKAELASKLADRDPQRAAQEIRDVESVSRKALHEVRDAIRGYRPTLADELARARALLDTARIGATIETSIDSADLKTRAGAEEALALALREAVTNVVRHSGASRATIRAWREMPSDSAILEVEDDGRGTVAREGTGLRGMRERVEGVDGSMIASSHNGTRLTITIPLVAAGAGA